MFCVPHGADFAPRGPARSQSARGKRSSATVGTVRWPIRFNFLTLLNYSNSFDDTGWRIRLNRLLTNAQPTRRRDRQTANLLPLRAPPQTVPLHNQQIKAAQSAQNRARRNDARADRGGVRRRRGAATGRPAETRSTGARRTQAIDLGAGPDSKEKKSLGRDGPRIRSEPGHGNFRRL